MTDNIKMMFNGRKIEFPINLNELLSQFNSQLVAQEEARHRPQPIPPRAIQHIVKQVVICKDTAVRDVVMEMNQRLNKLEELLKLKDQTPPKKIISKKKVNTKPIKLLMTKKNLKPKVKPIPKKVVKPSIKPKTKSIPKKNDKKSSKKKVSNKSKR